MRIKPTVLIVVAILGSVASSAFGQETAPLLGGGATPSRPPGAPQVFGTTVESFVSMGSWEFTPFDSGTTWSDLGFTSSTNLGRFSTVAGGQFAGVVHLPSGALVTSIELDYCNTNTGASTVDLIAFTSDQNGGSVGSLFTPISGPANTGCSSVSATGLSYTVDNKHGHLVLDVVTGAGDGTTSFGGVIVGYKLQVSPAPGSPTFTDVQPGDFGYQQIEALVAAGITGGCGGGNFCPTRNITRAEAAIFFAKALGLQWQ